MSAEKPLLVGIAGGTASGKTTLTERLVEGLVPDAVCISHDNYYRAQTIPFTEREKTNYDHPDSLETELLIADLQTLLGGESVEIPLYDFADHNRSSETQVINPVQFIFVEGILVLENEALAKMFALKIFVDADPEVRFARRILRDTKERGRTLEYVISQYLRLVKPMYDQFVVPSKSIADIVVNGEADISDAVANITNLLTHPAELARYLAARNSQ